MTDTELLDWFEEKGAISCAALVNDDNGHWAISCTGQQDVVEGEEPGTIWTSFFIEKEQWCNSIREAIMNFKKEFEM